MRKADAPWRVAVCAMAALAVAMGIGRFAFTPALPMMQDEFGITVAQGGWLAAANYVGYLAGALSAMRPGLGARFAIRFGLLGIAVATLAMGFTGSFVAWLALRALPGFASAWVLVYVSAWSLEYLGKAGRSDLGGTVYAGVGAGIVFAGLACLALSQAGFLSSDAWIVLGLAALCVTLVLWPFAATDVRSSTSDGTAAPRDIPEFWRLVFCYGAFGLGYIIPATFLPVMAKQVVSDPMWFGWAWPVFGAAAVISTFVAARLTAFMRYRSVWALGNLVMAAGAVIPVAVPGLMGIVIAAACVGSTFMVNTMVGMQEARRVAGTQARVLMAAMTAAFAVGQIVGPLLVSAFIHARHGFDLALLVAAIPLLFAAYTLFMNGGRNEQQRGADARSVNELAE